MTHRCTIERDSQHAMNADEWGNDLPAEWAGVETLTGVSCRYQYRDSVTSMDGEKRILSTERVLYLPYGTPLTDDDRIGDITDRRGRVLVEGPLRIDSLGAHEQDHLIAKLVRIT